MPLACLPRPTRRRRRAGLDARRAAPAPVPAVRAPVVQRPQAGVRHRGRDRTRSGASSTGSSRSSADPAHSALHGARQELVRRRRSGSRRSSRCRDARRRSDFTPGCSSRSAALFSSRSTTSGVLEWVGRLPVVELVVFPTFAAAVVSFAFAVLAGIGVQVLWSRDLRLRRFLTLLASAFVLLVVFARTGDRWGVITSAPRDYAAAVWGRGAFFAVLAIAAVVLASLARPTLGRAAPRRRHRRRALRARAVRDLREAGRPVPRSRLDAARPDGAWQPSRIRACSRSTPSCIRTPPARSGSRTSARSTRCTSSGTCATCRRSSSRTSSIGSRGREPPIAVQEQPDVRRARRQRVVLSASDLANVPGLRLLGRDGDTRVYENTSAYPRAWVVHDVHVVGGEDEAFAFLRGASRREDGAFIVDSFDPRHEAVVERGETTDERSERAGPGVPLCGAGPRPRDDRALLRRLRVAPGRHCRAPGCSSCPTPTSRAGRRPSTAGTADLPDRRRVPRRHRAGGHLPRRVPLRAAGLPGRGRARARRARRVRPRRAGRHAASAEAPFRPPRPQSQRRYARGDVDDGMKRRIGTTSSRRLPCLISNRHRVEDRWRFRSSAPGEPAVGRDDAAQRVDVRPAEIVGVLGPAPPTDPRAR